MTDRESRERLIDLLYDVLDARPDTVADHLIANGVVVLKQGVWKDNNNGTFTCSVCGGRASKMSYCGNCGAKLKEREKV